MLLRGISSIGCWRVSGDPGAFRSTFLRSRNLHAWLMMVCSGQFPPTRTMFSGILLKTKTLLDITCAPVVITLLFLVKTLAFCIQDTLCSFTLVPIYAYFLLNCSIV